MEVIGLGLKNTTLCPDELVTDEKQGTYSKLTLFNYTQLLFISLEWHWQIWGFVSGYASHKRQEPTEYEKITDLFVASKMQEENLGLQAETEGTKKGKWDTEQISTG